MSSGGAGWELGRLAATTFLTAVPALSAVPVLTNVFTFVAGAVADTGFTGLVSQLLEDQEGSESESFFERLMSGGSVRAMSLVGAGQSFAVVQVLIGLASVSQGMLCEKSSKGPADGAFLSSILQGLRCHFGSGMFTGLTGGVVNSVEARISLRTRNMNINVGANLACPPVVWRVFAQNKGRSQGSPLLLLAGPQEIGGIPEPIMAVRRDPNKTGSIPKASKVELEASARRRREIHSEIAALAKDLEAEVTQYRRAIAGMRGVLVRNREDPALWELYDRLLLRESWISRKHRMATDGMTSTQLDSWPIERCEIALASLKRTLTDAQQFFARVELPTFPPARAVSDAGDTKSFAQLQRMLQHTALPPELLEKIKNRVPRAHRTERTILLGLEGLIGLVAKERPATERSKLLSLLERFCDAETPDQESFEILLCMTFNFQQGLIARYEVLNVITETCAFYRRRGARASARGPFIGLFSQAMLMTDSRSAHLVKTLEAFATRHLASGARVILESRVSIGYATFVVETAKDESVRYAAAGILPELKGKTAFTHIASRLALELLKASEENPSPPILKNRLYIEIRKLDPEVSPEQLQFWAKQFLEEGWPRVVDQLVESSAGDAFLALHPDPDVAPEVMQRVMSEKRKYWTDLCRPLDQIEIACPTPGNYAVLSTLIIRSNDPSTAERVSSLQAQVEALKTTSPRSLELPMQMLLWAQCLIDGGKVREAFQVLWEGFPLHKRIRRLYHNLYVRALENVFPRAEERAISDPIVIQLFEDLLDRDCVARDPNFFRLPHPRFDLAPVQVGREGEKISLSLPVVRTGSSKEDPVGKFSVSISHDPNLQKLVARGENADIFDRKSEGQGVGVFVVERIFCFLTSCGIRNLVTDAERMGIYSWLRMGADFVDPQSKVQFLRSCMDKGRMFLGEDIPLEDVPTESIVQALASVSRTDRERVVLSYEGCLPLVFDLTEGSVSRRRFEAYYRQKLLEIVRPSGRPSRLLS